VPAGRGQVGGGGLAGEPGGGRGVLGPDVKEEEDAAKREEEEEGVGWRSGEDAGDANTRRRTEATRRRALWLGVTVRRHDAAAGSDSVMGRQVQLLVARGVLDGADGGGPVALEGLRARGPAHCARARRLLR